MSIGKNPHRPEGKKGADEWDGRKIRQDAEENVEVERRERERRFRETRNVDALDAPAEEENVGGSRPGVPSRVKDAIEERESRDNE